LQEALLSQIEAANAEKHIDLFFSYFYSSFADPATIHRIGEFGITTVNWYCNASYQFDLVREIAPAYAYCLVPERFRLADYRAVGARPIYCQEAANPDVYRPFELPREFDVAFVGAAYGDRPGYIRALLEAGVDVRVWGPGWSRFVKPQGAAARLRRAASRFRNRTAQPVSRVALLPAHIYGGLLADEEMVRTFSRSRISLGFSSVGDTGRSADPVRQVRLRDFEVPMAGGFYLLEYVDEIEEFFVPGAEIGCFEGAEDLVAKVRHYLAHPDEREAVRRAGHERALRDHTWQRRLSGAFAEMGLVDAPGDGS
jgi:spore maturation protein CgeB